MRILHTADWHMGDRLGRIDRTNDIRRNVERIAAICERSEVDVLLVAGDLFSELSRPDSLRGSIEHLQKSFGPFLLNGGTILAVTGNHDNETFCQTLQTAMNLAAPTPVEAKDVRASGRLYLATHPELIRLQDDSGTTVQFLLMPYPSSRAYLDTQEKQRFGSLEEKNQILQKAYAEKIKLLQASPEFQVGIPSVLVAHIHVQGSQLPNLFRMTEQESIIFQNADLPMDMTYIALGHIHQHQQIMDLPHIRYSSSIERLDLGERNDQKGVVLLEINANGLIGTPEFLPLPATKIYRVQMDEPATDLPKLRDEYPNATQDLVNIEFTYQAGKDNLEDILRELDELFPRWYRRSWNERGDLGPSLNDINASHGQSVAEIVRSYVAKELIQHSNEDQQAVMAIVEQLLADKQS